MRSAECGVRSAECGVRSAESAECGKCGVWKLRSVEIAECGKCGVWKMIITSSPFSLKNIIF